MALYEQRLANDLAKIRGKVVTVGNQVEEALKKGVNAVMTGDRDLANDVILGDLGINREFIEINRLCHGFLALHLPTAGHLRLISSILRLNGEIERIGDHAATIAREALQMSESPVQTFKVTLETMAEGSQNLLRRAIKAFNENDPDAARETIALSARVVTEFDKAFNNLVEAATDNHGNARDLLLMSVVYRKLERVSARAENICEETVFATTGETPEPKRFRILFLDEGNDGQSRIAEAVGNTMAGDVCTFASAGRGAAKDLHPGLADFMYAHGLAGGNVPPRAIDPASEEVSSYDIIVSLDGPTIAYIPDQPFRTLFLDWDVGRLPEGLDKPGMVTHYYEIYRELMVRIRDLVDILHGEKT